MDIEQFSRRMIELMPKCIRGFQGYESNHLSRGQISQPQFLVLEFLSRRKDSCLMSELASFLNISRPAATGLVDRLTAQKLVDRRMDESDRRTVHVGITPKGKKIVSGIWEQKRRSMVKVFSKISASERKQYLDILEKVVNTFTQNALCWIIAGILFLTALRCADASEGPLVNVSLKECYQLALERSETVAIQAQVIKEAEGRFFQSMSGFLPKVDFVDLEKHQGKGSRSADTSSLTYLPQRAFTFTQPLFSGFKEFAGMAASKAERKQRKYELIRAKQLLFTDVSDAFYLLKSYQEDLLALQDIDKALQDYGAELKRRHDLGRSRSSEVSIAFSRLYQNEATIASVETQMQNARELMEFLVGRPVESLAGSDVTLGDLSPKEEYVKKADTRPDVQAAESALIVAQKQVMIARAGFFPTVDLVANRYVKRVGASSNVDWDATLEITVPIFDGTNAYGQVKTATANAEESRLLLSQTKRRAVLDIENAYTRVVQGKKQVDAYKKAVDAAQQSYDDLAADYKNALVNNLDVLQSVQDLQTTRRSYITIENDIQRAYWALKVATGDIADDTL